ncbi:MAG: hypothetical protein IT355_09985 [Gemmatimonadaceae bacterium]|nr:hypothetical protein [Gemmatimonadaceae bacterium]
MASQLVCAPVLTGQAAVSLYRLGSPEDQRDRRLSIQRDSQAPVRRLMQSATTRTRLVLDSAGRLRIAAVLPDAQLTYNSDFPWTLNDGAMWAGRGTTVQVSGGVALTWQRLRVIVAPTFWRATNTDYARPTDPEIVPPIPAPRNPYGSPYHWYSRSMDMPRRFGPGSVAATDLGTSAAWLSWDKVEAGLANEQEWWGPGLQNALLLSNNAAGFGHAFVRTRQPLQTRIGAVDARYLVGTLTTSRFFEDGKPTSPARAIGAAIVTLQPRRAPGLTIGTARMVIGAIEERPDVLGRLFDVFRNVGRPNARPFWDPTQTRGRDQLFELFGHYSPPGSGLEVWYDWGRAEQPRTLGDLLGDVGHSQAFTAGLQGIRRLSPTWSLGVQLEHTQTEQSSSYRARPTGSWYTSRSVIQGFTQRGQVLGAAVGPGANSQFLAVDGHSDRWSVGAFAGRLRWDDDSFYSINKPMGNGLCKHDVSLYGGVRGVLRTRTTLLASSVTMQNRLNAYWASTGLCFFAEENVDRRNLTLQFSITPRLPVP